ncbi:hypothetical protein [Desulfocurvibacter africanus]|uniref:Uncharacterized protein n=1 Tax=Desulfocurvibacter africanus subsp. africanus str. Walvis Bay TaxID=690850 RepID=F3Z1I8_DESAF|nr:hypothetical protein [Desulfocurvibacter africanus]EGJ50019.1 hypothetical protein Desaf_1683 [Desulfocurvibacter africanus subsp. africanus str. Walvis Bay]
MFDSYVEYKLSSSLTSKAAPEHLRREISGTIRSLNLDDQYEEAGRLTATILDLQRAAAEGVDRRAVFAHDRNTLEIWEHLYGRGASLDVGLAKLLERGNLIVIDKIAVYHKHRGRNLALRALADTLRSFRANCDLAILKVYPLQFSKGSASFDIRLRMDLLPRDWDTSRAKLKAHYQKLGFQCRPDSDFMFIASDEAHERLTTWRSGAKGPSSV